MKTPRWKRQPFNAEQHKDRVLKIIKAISNIPNWDRDSFRKVLSLYPREGKSTYSKSEILAVYRYLTDRNLLKPDTRIELRLKMKPVRTISGVAPVTVLTKPHPCPGRCIFCPDDSRMPKSYIANEPGAQRALSNNFDPFLQVENRLKALRSIGHKADKVELIVLGGTWSSYPDTYQQWFIKRCLEAMNETGSKTKIQSTKVETKEAKIAELCSWGELTAEQKRNGTADTRCVGLSVETRPDMVTKEEAIKLRKLGVTKVQLGVQSLDDVKLRRNKRGHTSADTKKAFRCLRLAGFKIQVHWMPNLFRSSPKSDITDYSMLWIDDFRPDEIKIYPTSLFKGTKLYDMYEKGKYRPYSYRELVSLLKEMMIMTPPYCRISRVIRDFSSGDIAAGNRKSNLRENVEKELEGEGQPCNCIRCREIRGNSVKGKDLQIKDLRYKTSTGEEIFLACETEDSKLAGFLRLSLPDPKNLKENIIPEIRGSALIREVHVYGEAVGIGQRRRGRAQHTGLGRKLIDKAVCISKKAGYSNISVISAVGTREYYRKQGFALGKLYMTRAV